MVRSLSPWVMIGLLAGCSSVLGFDEIEVVDNGHGTDAAIDGLAGGSGGSLSDASTHDGKASGGSGGSGGKSPDASAGSGGGAGSSTGGSGIGGSSGGSTGGAGGSAPTCPDQNCNGSEDCQSCPQDCGSCPVAEPDQLVGIHFWDQGAPSVLGTQPYYDVEAFESATSPATIVSWLTEREATGARGIIRIDYQWGHSVPTDSGQLGEYTQRLVGIARAVHDAGLQTHHYIVGNESNLPQEGGASPSQVGEAYAAARAAIQGAGPWSIMPVLLTTPPSTAAEYGGGDGSYLTNLLNEAKARTTIEGIAIHAYENSDSGGSANLLMSTVAMEMGAIANAGMAGVPVFITEMNVDVDAAGDGTGAVFVHNAYQRLNAWNQGQEGNPLPGTLVIAAACWFVWYDDGNWTRMALNTASHPQTRAAFQAEMAQGYHSVWPQ